MKAIRKVVVAALIGIRPISSRSSPYRAPLLILDTTQRYLPRIHHQQTEKTVRLFSSSPRHRATQKTQTQTKNNTSLPDDPVLIPEAATLLAKTGKISCAYFDGNGSLVTTDRELTKPEIAKQFELRHRDLRDVDIVSEATTRVLVRPATILLHFFDLCVIIQPNETLLIDLQKIKTGSDNRGSSDSEFYKNFERRLSGLTETADVPPLPYELRAVEASIIAVLSDIRTNLIQAKEEADYNIQHLNLGSGYANLELDSLFESSRRLGKIEQKARLVRTTIRELLDTDEDLAGMYLSDRAKGRPHDISDHQEAEYMLEAYHTAADGLAESAHASISMIRKKEAVFRSSLAVQRNQIMFLEARIAIHTLGLAAGTLVAGLFGMNLVNYYEEAPYGFAVVTGVCVALSSMFSMYGMRNIWRIRQLKVQDRTIFGRSRAGRRV